MNLAAFLDTAARRWPDNAAVEWRSATTSYASFTRRIGSLAAALHEAGLSPGDRVALLQRNRPELLESLWACFHGGFVAVPINARLTPAETQALLRNAAVSAFIGTPEYVEHASALAEKPAAVRIMVGEEQPLPSGWRAYEDVVASCAPRPIVTVPPDAGAWLFYTSGTTGQLKGASLSHRNLTAMISHFLADIDRPGPTDRILHCAPLTHGSGLYALPAMVRGATQAITAARSFDPTAIWGSIRDGDVTAVAFVAPTMLKLLAEEAADERPDEGFRFVVYGGAPMSTSDLRRAVEVFGETLIQIYGQGEAPMSISTLSGADHLTGVQTGDDGILMSAGYPYTCGEVAIIDGATGQAVAPGEVGEIATRGDVVMQGYWNNEEATSSALKDGWLRTGDIGFQAPDGRLTLLDREKDVIISGGSNVYPREVEELLLAHPGVREGLVVGAPHERWGETVVAVLLPEPSWDGDREQLEADLLRDCATNLADYKRPRRFEWVDELPKSAYGKLLRREIRERYWQGHDRRI